jgi:hypothetical protein
MKWNDDVYGSDDDVMTVQVELQLSYPSMF